MLRWIQPFAFALWRDRRGSYSMVTALMLPVLVGSVGLGTETGLWYFDHQKMQGAADAAAYSAEIAYAAGNTAGYQTEAKAVAAQYGFVDGSGGTTVTINRPPSSGSYTAAPAAIEVIIQQPQQRLFSAVFTSSTLNVKARAVATQTTGGTSTTPPCMLALDPTAAGAVTLFNNAVLPSTTCGIWSNSSSSSGITLTDNAVVDGPTASHGGDLLENNAALNGKTNLTNAIQQPDPYASENPPTAPSCTSQTSSGTGPQRSTLQLKPDTTVNGVGVAHFCNGLNFTNNFAVNFAPGVYFIDSQLTFGNNAVITGSGVTLVVNGNYAISIGNNASVTLSAPTSGPTSGIAFFGGRSATSSVVQDFSNNTILNLTGAIYFPNQILNFDNNASSAGSNGCTQLIGRMIQLQNNVSLGSNCANSGVTPIGGFGSTTVALVE
jgi:Flp pilus assembly protein TadG